MKSFLKTAFCLLFIICSLHGTGFAGDNDLKNSTCDPSAASFSPQPDSIYKISDSVTYVYSRPKNWSFITNFFKDYGDFGKLVWRKESIGTGVFVVMSTGLLLVFDQTIVDNVQHFSKDIGIYGTTQTTKLINWSIKSGNSSIALPLLVPQDANSAFYFLGDGTVHLAITAGFWVYGLCDNDYRARNTASQLGEALLTVGVATQFLKHICGRETPMYATQPGGYWDWFPNQSEYSKHVPRYDAYPSGHLATAMATITVIADNYSEKKYIRPLGYSLMALLGYSMINNGVHWASDYPLGIAIGYGFAKVITHRALANVSRSKTTGSHGYNPNKLHPQFLPSFGFGNAGIQMICRF
jgi:hypothetical protein